jgi:hypothetical protein
MSDCNRKQREISNGEEAFRCISLTSEHYLTIIDDRACSGCPLFNGSVERKPQAKGFDCEFHVVANGKPRCAVTNLPTNEEICKRCVKETREQTANFSTKVISFTKAIKRWVASGMPERTDEEVKELYENHCKKCVRYDEKLHACKTCGCAVSLDNSPLKNKLKMKTESCPLGRF